MFTRTENGAEVELTIVEKPVNGAVEQADGVFRVKDGAEEEVWSDVQLIYRMDTPPDSCMWSPTEWGRETTIQTCDDYSESDQTLRLLVAEETYINPTFAFTWRGEGDAEGFSIGSIYIYGKPSAGEYVYSDTVITVKSEETGEVEVTLEGTFVGVGLEWRGMYDDSSEYNILYLSNLIINGRKYITDERDDYDRRVLP